MLLLAYSLSQTALSLRTVFSTHQSGEMTTSSPPRKDLPTSVSTASLIKYISFRYMLVRVQDVPRYLGCRVLRMSPAWDIINLAPNPLPRPLHELASRNELVSWLTRVFFAIIIPGKGNAHITSVRYPNNLVAFIELLVHLYRVGFPAHWLADFLQSVISDSLTTDIAPYLGKLPIPVAEIYRRVTRRKVCLEPWLADLENILAMSYESLPFAFCGPPGFSKSYSEIGLFETTISQHVLDPATSMNMLPPHVPVVSLIFYKPGSFAPRYLLSNLTQIIEGKKLTGQGELFVLTSVESFSIKDGVVRWRMSKKRIRKMKMQKWVMISYRFDVDDIGQLSFCTPPVWSKV